MSSENNEINKPNRFDQIRELMTDVIFFLSEDGTPFARFGEQGNRILVPVESSEFETQVSGLTYGMLDLFPEKRMLEQIKAYGKYHAHREPVRQSIYLRVGERDDASTIDLCDGKGTSIIVDKNGWRIVQNESLNFYRPRHLHPLPHPQTGGSITPFKDLLNLKSLDDFWLVIAFIQAALLRLPQYPVLIIQGLQGSAKSTVSRMIKALTDPSKPILRNLPKTEQELFIAARCNHLLALDNLSGINTALSDAICRISTGGGFATRKLYTTSEEDTIDVVRPIILNGIDDLPARPDLLDRAIVLTVPVIPSDKRRSDSEIQTTFNRELPGIFGAILDSLVSIKQKVPYIRLSKLPRMAEFAKVAVAGLGHFGLPQETVLEYLFANQNEAIESCLELNPLARVILKFMESKSFWTGSMTQLKNEFDRIVYDLGIKDRTYPDSLQGLSRAIDRLTPVLKGQGIVIEKHRSSAGREIIFKNSKQMSSYPSLPSQPLTIGPNHDDFDDNDDSLNPIPF